MYGALRLRPARRRCHFGRRRRWEEGGFLWLLPPFCRWRLSAEGAGGGCRSQPHTPRHPLASPTGDLATVCFGERGWPWLEGREEGAEGGSAGRLRKGGRGVPLGGRGRGGGLIFALWGLWWCGAGPCPVFLHARPAFLPPSRRAVVRTRLARRPRPRPRLPVLGRRCRGCPRAVWRAYGSGAASATCPAVVVQEKCFLKLFLIFKKWVAATC